MGTVRVEYCPDCGQMVGEGMLYPHMRTAHAPMTLDGARSNLRNLLVRYGFPLHTNHEASVQLEAAIEGIVAAAEGRANG